MKVNMPKTIINQIQIQLPSGTMLYLSEEDLRDLHLKLNEMFGKSPVELQDQPYVDWYKVFPVDPLPNYPNSPYEITCKMKAPYFNE